MRRARSIGMTVDGLMCDVKALVSGKPVQVLSGLFPCEVFTDGFIVVQIGGGVPLPA